MNDTMRKEEIQELIFLANPTIKIGGLRQVAGQPLVLP